MVGIYCTFSLQGRYLICFTVQARRVTQHLVIHVHVPVRGMYPFRAETGATTVILRHTEKVSTATLSLMCSCTDASSIHALHELYRSTKSCTAQIMAHNTRVTIAKSLIFYLGSIDCMYPDRHNFFVICSSYNLTLKR